MDALGDRHGPIFALKHEFGQAQNSCYSTVARKREMREIRAMNFDETDRERRRAALSAFYKANKPLGLKSVNRWAKRSGIAEATLRQLIDGTRTKNMRADTYEKILRGASELLQRDVNLFELLGTSEAEPASSVTQEPEVETSLLDDLDIIGAHDPDERANYEAMIRNRAAAVRARRQRDPE